MAAACSSAPSPDLRALYDEAASSLGEDRVPVIVLPGVLGSRLVDKGDRVVWGAFVHGAADADCPEGARAVALPMDPQRSLAALIDDVRATVVLDELEVDLGFLRRLRVRAYHGILATLAAGQYADQTLLEAGNVDYGGSHFTCFQRAYDWRRDISESASVLHEQILEAQRRVRAGRALAPDEAVRVDVVAHSMGGLLLRYYLRYGATPLPEDGSLPPLTWAGAQHVRNAVFVGTPGFGSVDALQQLVEGLDLHPFFPNYRPAVLGTMPAIYQLLPRVRHGRVVEESTGEPLDLFDIREVQSQAPNRRVPSTPEGIAQDIGRSSGLAVDSPRWGIPPALRVRGLRVVEERVPSAATSTHSSWSSPAHEQPTAA